MNDIIVAGGGPAGLTAALYAARAGRSVLVLEQTAPGGQIVYSPLVENYPGLPGMSGAQFSQQLADQVEALGVELEYAAVRGFHPGQMCIRDSNNTVGCRKGPAAGRWPWQYPQGPPGPQSGRQTQVLPRP